MNRRQVLISGGAAALVTFGAGAWSLGTPSMAKASEPWRKAGMHFGDARLNALSHAILAPNPHNRQPWQFELVGDDRIDVTCDLDKRLDATDPFDRQITIGFGCMLELLRIAAAEQGYAALIEGFPDGEPQARLDAGRIARVRMVKGGAQPDPLYAHILTRRSNKEPYSDRLVSKDALESVFATLPPGVTGEATVDPERVAHIRRNAIGSWVVEYETEATRRESIDLMRIGNEAAVANPDGIDMGGAFMSLANATGVVTQEKLDTPGSYAYNSGREMYEGLIASTSAFLWLTTPGNSRSEQLAAGAAWVRTNLAAEAAGIALHPWSQALQEFPEMRSHYQEAHMLLAPEGGTVQMFARAGYGPATDASPRWPLEAKLIEARLIDA